MNAEKELAEAKAIAQEALKAAGRALETLGSARIPAVGIGLQAFQSIAASNHCHLGKISTDVEIDRARAKDIQRARLVLIQALDELKALDVPHAA